MIGADPQEASSRIMGNLDYAPGRNRKPMWNGGVGNSAGIGVVFFFLVILETCRCLLTGGHVRASQESKPLPEVRRKAQVYRVPLS